VSVRQGMAQVPVVAAVKITTAILVLVAQMAVPEVAQAAVQAVEAREMGAQEVAIPVMVPRMTVPEVAGLAVAPHMPLIVASRPEASLEWVWLMSPVEMPQRITNLAMALMLLLKATLPEGETSPSFGL